MGENKTTNSLKRRHKDDRTHNRFTKIYKSKHMEFSRGLVLATKLQQKWCELETPDFISKYNSSQY